jgi:hypothetical protein
VRAGQSHITSIVVNCPAPDLFARLSDPKNLHRWSFGTWKTELRGDGLIHGMSLFDGAGILVRIDKDETRLTSTIIWGLNRKSSCRAFNSAWCPAAMSGSAMISRF